MSSTSLPRPEADASHPLNPIPPVSDAGILTLYAPDKADAIGLLAYALHRHTVIEWVEAFTTKTERAPDAAAFSQFYIGETMPGRIAAYRAEAERVLEGEKPQRITKAEASPLKPTSRSFLTWGLEEAIANAKAPIPWRALAIRLFILLLAVVVTALVLRVLFVPQ